MAVEEADQVIGGFTGFGVLINGAEMTFDAHVPADFEPLIKVLLEGHETVERHRFNRKFS